MSADRAPRSCRAGSRMGAIRIVGREAAVAARILKLHLIVCVVTMALLAAVVMLGRISAPTSAAAPPPTAGSVPSLPHSASPLSGPALDYAFEEMYAGEPVRFDP